MKIQVHQVLISLLLGIAIGMFSQQCMFRHFGHPHHRHMKKHMMNKLSHELNLTSEQKTKIEAIFEAMRPKMKALHSETRPKFEELHKEAQAEIRVLLTPEQQVKFDEFNLKMEKKFRDREKRMEERD